MPDKRKILIVDDEERMRKLVRDFLVKKNFAVVEAADGSEALDLFFADSEISLVILDVMMPKLNGYQVARQLRKEKKWSAYSDAYRQKSAGGSYRRLGGGC